MSAIFEHTTSSDVYARYSELDAATVRSLADRLEIRAADPRQQRLWSEFLAGAPAFGGGRVLEIGCGTGVITALIAGLPGVGEVVGVDPVPYFVERARARLPDVRFEVADGRGLPFGDESFDGVVFSTTLCHIPGPERALAEAHRVLRTGGHLLVYDGDYATTTVATSDVDPLQTCAATAVRTLVHDPWLVRRLPALLREAGFSPEELRSHGHLELTAPTYMLSLIDLGADTLVARGTLAPASGEAFKAEARGRVAAGRFFGHIAYASVRAERR
ncbi:methyltransferase domain-containing protein [Blastococcus sp. PRF04-17]|uniref:methyltransferase domain-containing protein n=1 Tax=Blastococcus sp. PRF04-17 TaxID=2933797 RepID=UPI001FF68A70|nr:methyltransferase domain-containing protein [Blastococcus sp. PRF04-17]UOY01374.1 methyltransferase domain-containing protein [Blastococcus sp. PRF04-17]